MKIHRIVPWSLALVPTIVGATLLTAAANSTPPRATSADARGAESYSVDPAHSSVVFKTNHLGVSEFFGRFNSISGEVTFNADHLADSSVLIEIPVASLDTNDAKRDGHLRSADFFSAKEFPSLIFESKAVSGAGDDLKVEGLLTLRDTTREIGVAFTKIGEADAMGAHRLGFSARFRIDMRDFGFQFVQQQPGAVGPEVEIWVALELTRD